MNTSSSDERRGAVAARWWPLVDGPRAACIQRAQEADKRDVLHTSWNIWEHSGFCCQ